MATSHALSGIISLLLVWIMTQIDAVDKGLFKKCEDSSFCRLNRAIQPGESPYSVVKDSIVFSDSSIDVNILNTKRNVTLKLKVQTLKKNSVRFSINEANPIRERYQVKDVLVQEPETVSYQILKQDDESVHIGFGNNSVVLTNDPFRLDFLVNKEVVVSVNARGLMNFEEYKEKRKVPVKIDEGEGHPPGENEEEKPEKETEEGEGVEKKEEVVEEENWEENFKEHKDTRPRGPCSVGLDISFPGFEHVYGIPEHADSLALKTTVGSEPYRLYNLDVFEYELDSRMALYGSIPVMLAHSVAQTVGVFWMNAAETWVDISSSNARKEAEEVPQVETHWISESGIIDVFVMLGPKPHDVFQEYASFTGTTALPPLFGISYHQSRWNYNDEEDVENVDSSFDEHDIPYDVLWLDIEHTDGKKYMTWDKLKFPSPEQMQKNLAAKGRKMVTIIDPHIKREGGYHIHEEATKLGYYVKNKDGGEYDNWCWPGSSSWIDFTNPEIRKWWAGKFALSEYQGSTETLFTWNDMNEPSVFHGPEVTMHKDALHYADWEHRDIHNVYGFYQHMATVQGLIDRSGGSHRPFVLSRAFFAGTQRHGPIWTGDNMASWDHLKASLPMILSLNLVGLPFSGADVGGFFNNPDPELLVRWYQAAAFMPFYRAHAHLDTKRREPWLFEANYKNIIRNAVRLRYTLLPYWYTLFYHASDTGTPIVRPLWVEFPEEKSTFSMEDEFLLGENLLVKPVTTQGQSTIDVYLPGKDEYWYDLSDYKIYKGESTIYVSTPLEKIPLFQRGGSVIATKQRVRRCSALMHRDPYTLTIALNPKARAEGDLYVDDGYTLDYKSGAYIYMNFTFQGGRLMARKANPGSQYKSESWIERIVIVGISNSPKGILLTADGGESRRMEFRHDANTNTMTIKKPAVNIGQEWTISMHA
ncbi:neutral alpha-glucosidase AB-like isoform X2 [Acropora palmata]|uniref:neutral alpha-glucosidase AB-like isoform X2 n=1 Tax=Acropora palmata TaxID=6131 RepID=UPI003DA1638F